MIQAIWRQNGPHLYGRSTPGPLWSRAAAHWTIADCHRNRWNRSSADWNEMTVLPTVLSMVSLLVCRTDERTNGDRRLRVVAHVSKQVRAIHRIGTKRVCSFAIVMCKVCN